MWEDNEIDMRFISVYVDVLGVDFGSVNGEEIVRCFSDSSRIDVLEKIFGLLLL